jgi:hypothetical protein
MKKHEVAKIIDMAMDAYPSAKITDPVRMVNTWHKFLEFEDSSRIISAMDFICRTKKYFPCIAEVLDNKRSELE